MVFDRLASTQDEENPFESAVAGLAKFGELQCYQKVHDVPKTIQTAVSAARLFIKTADNSYFISRCMRETWADPLADGLHCYRVAIDLLKESKKTYIAARLLMETAGVEARFDFVHDAANTYQEAVDVIIEGKAPAPLLFEALLATIEAYVNVDRFDLALASLSRARDHFFADEGSWVSPSPMMKDNFNELNVYYAELLLVLFRFEDCIVYSAENLDTELARLFKELVEATRGHLLYQIDQLIVRARRTKKFTAQQMNLFDKHLEQISRIVEHGFSNVMG